MPLDMLAVVAAHYAAAFVRFVVVRFPPMTWSKDQMWEVINCCVVLHNMIIEDERKDPVSLLEEDEPYYRQGPLAKPDHQVPPT